MTGKKSLRKVIFLIKPMLCNHNSTDCPLIATTPSPENQWLPMVGPQFQNHVALKNTDGLMAFFISDSIFPSMTTIQEQLLIDGHRDKRQVLLICHKNK